MKKQKEWDHKNKDQKDQKRKGKADKDIKAKSVYVFMEVGQLSTQVEPLSGQQQLSASTDQLSASTDIALSAMSAHYKHQNDWIFNTTASLYMTLNLGMFETFSVNSETIEVASETFLKYEGKGLCLVYLLYLNGTSSVVSLTNVLYIPTLGHNLILQNVLRNHFSCLMGGNHMYVKNTRHASQLLILHRLFHRNLLFLIESKPTNAFSNTVFLTYSKAGFHTESSASKPAIFTESKSNAFTELKLSTSLMAYSKPSTSLMANSHQHKSFDHVDTFA